MLHKLPPEILDMVAQSLTSKQDLKSLALVSRAVHRGVQRTLWSSLDLWPIEEDELWHFNWKPVFHENLPAFIYPTELNFRSTISSPQGERCPHWRDQESPPNNRLHANSRFGCLALMAESVVRISPPRRLRKFTWGLGTCIPGKILGRRGILARTQPQLSSLDLTTVGDCLIRDEIDLSPFRRLKEFRWRGPRADDLDAIADVLQTNCEHLTSLELDFVDWDRLRDQMGYEPEIDAIEGVVVDRFFHTKILSIGPQTILEKPIFPALVSLSLSSVPLLGRTARALDFTALKSLTIRKCPQWDRFLAEIPKLGVPLRLKSLEVHQQYEAQTPRGTVMTPEHEILIRFITSFTGLEELFLSLIGPIDSMALWNKVVKRHGTTLKRFVHHLCAPEDNGPTPASNNNIGTPAITVIPYIYDIPDFDLAPKLRELSEKNPLSNIYQPESIGLSCIPEVLGPMFSSFVRTHTSNPSLKLIHVRQSRPVDSDIDRTSARDLAANPTILLPTSYNGSFQTGARHPVSVHESIYGASSIFPDIGAQGTNKDQGQKYEDSELEVDWANEAERIVELTENGSPLLHHPDNGNSSANSSRHPSPSRNSSAFSPSYHEALIWPDQLQPGLRQSLVRFANWAFGPKGISSLEVIACGDFAHGRWNRGRELGNVFLVRNRNKDNRGCQNLNFLVFWPGLQNGPGSQSLQRQKAGYYLTGIPKVDQIIETNRRFLEASPMEPLVDDDLTWPGPYRDMS